MEMEAIPCEGPQCPSMRLAPHRSLYGLGLSRGSWGTEEGRVVDVIPWWLGAGVWGSIFSLSGMLDLWWWWGIGRSPNSPTSCSCHSAHSCISGSP